MFAPTSQTTPSNKKPTAKLKKNKMTAQQRQRNSRTKLRSEGLRIPTQFLTCERINPKKPLRKTNSKIQPRLRIAPRGRYKRINTKIE